MGAENMFAAGAGIQAGSQFGSGIGGFLTGNAQSKAFGVNAAGLQQGQVEESFRGQSARLVGSYKARTAAGGLKFSGSPAESLNQSLTQLNMAESNQIFDIKMRKIQSDYKAKSAKIRARGSLISGVINTGTTALSSYGTYDKYWGSR